MQVYLKIFILLLLASCLREKHEGIVITPEDISQIHVGQNMNEVVKILGTPSIVLNGSLKGEETIIYASITKEWRAFLKPRTKEQMVLELKFSKKRLQSIRNHTDVTSYENDSEIDTNIEVEVKPLKKPA